MEMDAIDVAGANEDMICVRVNSEELEDTYFLSGGDCFHRFYYLW